MNRLIKIEHMISHIKRYKNNLFIRHQWLDFGEGPNVDKKEVLKDFQKKSPLTRKRDEKDEEWQRHNDFTQDRGSWVCDHKHQQYINGMSKHKVDLSTWKL